MQTLIKKFKVDASENILLNKDVLQAIEINFGQRYVEKLRNEYAIEMKVTILFDNDTSVKVKSFKEQKVAPQDTINGVFIYPKNSVYALFPTKSTSGIVLIEMD